MTRSLRTLLLALGLATLAVPSAHAEAGGALVYTEPLGAALFATNGDLFLPLGLALPVGPRSQLLVEVTPTSGSWHPCSSRSRGVFGKVGLRHAFGPAERSHDGFFLQPRAGVRYLSTSGGDADGWLGCSAEGLAHVQGDELEVSVGLDVGYRWTFGSLYVAPVFGASVGWCQDCLDDGHPLPVLVNLFPQPSPRADRFVSGLNLNLLQVGWAF